jgi:transcriptional regulator with XRE-family HTH domain
MEIKAELSRRKARGKKPRFETPIKKRAAGLLSIEDNAVSAKSLRQKLGLDQQDMARLLDLSVRTLSDLETGKLKPGLVAQRRMTEIKRFYERLSKLIRFDTNASGKWFTSANRSLHGLSPVETIERGQIDRLWEMIFQLESGALA